MRAVRRSRFPRRSRRTNLPVEGAIFRLKGFRQASLLAVAITGILLILFSAGEADLPPENDVDLSNENQIEPSGQEAAEEAIGAIHQILRGFYGNLPKIIVAAGVLLLAWILVRLIRALLWTLLKRWERFNAVTAIVGLTIGFMAIGIALSILAGGIRALVGSLRLVGLALSWALQTPIESFTGWLLNSFKGYYRVGNRISCGRGFRRCL